MQSNGPSDDANQDSVDPNHKRAYVKQVIQDALKNGVTPPSNKELRAALTDIYGSGLCNSEVAKVRAELGISGHNLNAKLKKKKKRADALNYARHLGIVTRKEPPPVSPEDIIAQINDSHARVAAIAKAMRDEGIVRMSLHGKRVDFVREELNNFELPD